jgi:tRNA (guanine37-N1)-methyltransferase
MRIDVISSVPKILFSPINESIIKRATSKGLVKIVIHDLRDYAKGKYRQIDDKPYGGGGGMVLKPEPFYACIEKLLAENDYDEIIHLTPQGITFDQEKANFLSLKKNIIILCGHYKGIDQRVIDKFVTLEISVGNYVLTGGEIASLILIDSIVRLIPNALGNSESALSDTFQTEGIFDSPQYTRPAVFKGRKVPKILLEGNHKIISGWRIEKGQKKFNKVKKFNKLTKRKI